MYGISGVYDSCVCPAGYTLAPGAGGAAPTCAPDDPTWPPEVPRCGSSPQTPEEPASLSTKTLIAIGVGALALALYWSR